MNYRGEVNELVTETRWTLLRVAPLFFGCVLVLGGLGFGARSMGLIGSTMVERMVFENSYQRTSALASEIALQGATVQVLEASLRTAQGARRATLQTQLMAAKIRLNTARRER